MKGLKTKIIKNLILQTTEKLYRITRSFFKIYDSEQKLSADAKDYWNKPYDKNPRLAQDAHWNDKGIFEDNRRWERVGKENLELLQQRKGLLNIDFPVNTILEWGCGGGANAIHLAPNANDFIGVDISEESLKECGKQLKSRSLNNFTPVLIDATQPEQVFEKIGPEQVDLFLCTYVFELLPSRNYGQRILEIASKLLKPGGAALIQIRYHLNEKNFRPQQWNYRRHPYTMTTYGIEEFWKLVETAGLRPLSIYLLPDQPLVNDKNYAYYFIQKPERA